MKTDWSRVAGFILVFSLSTAVSIAALAGAAWLVAWVVSGL